MTPFFEPIWPWPIVLAAVLSLVGLVLWTYPARVRHLSPFRRRCLLGLRLAAVCLLAFAMLRPGVELRESEQGTATLIVLADATRSMQTPDGPGGLTRRQTLLKTWDESAERLLKLADKVELKYFDFSDQLTQVTQLDNETTGTQTAIGAVLEDLSQDLPSRKLLGVILASDGAQRAVAPRNTDPLAIARQYAARQVPIYTLAFGKETLADTSVDLAIEDLLVNPVVFEKKTVPITARVRILGAAERPIRVRLLVEDRTGKSPGEVGPLRSPQSSQNAVSVVEVRTSKNNDLIPVELSFIPKQIGEVKIGVVVEGVENEVKQANNLQQTIISVQKGGLRVAYFDRLRWEPKFIKRVRYSDKIQLDVITVREGPFQNLNKIDSRLFDPGAYDAYIIGDVPAAVFGKQQIGRLYQRIKEGAGLMMIGGYHNFAGGGYAATPLADVLPVRLSDRPQNAAQIERDLQMVPTRVGLNQFVMRLDPDAQSNQRLWSGLPKLSGACQLQVKPDLPQVLATSADGLPLLVAHEFGQARVLAFAADTTWQWSLGTPQNRQAHARFWQQIILWLAHKELDSDQPVWIRVDPKNYSPRQAVDLEFGFRDSAGNPTTEVDFQLDILGPDLVAEQPAPVKQQTRFEASFRQTETAGDYWARVRKIQDNNLTAEAWTRFIVDPHDLELDNPAADPGLLDEIALVSGGSRLSPEQLGQRIDEWLDKGVPNLDLIKIDHVNLWDNWSFLAVFIGMMSTEWLLRKKRGLA